MRYSTLQHTLITADDNNHREVEQTDVDEEELTSSRLNNYAQPSLVVTPGPHKYGKLNVAESSAHEYVNTTNAGAYNMLQRTDNMPEPAQSTYARVFDFDGHTEDDAVSNAYASVIDVEGMPYYMNTGLPTMANTYADVARRPSVGYQHLKQQNAIHDNQIKSAAGYSRLSRDVDGATYPVHAPSAYVSLIDTEAVNVAYSDGTADAREAWGCKNSRAAIDLMRSL